MRTPRCSAHYHAREDFLALVAQRRALAERIMVRNINQNLGSNALSSPAVASSPVFETQLSAIDDAIAEAARGRGERLHRRHRSQRTADGPQRRPRQRVHGLRLGAERLHRALHRRRRSASHRAIRGVRGLPDRDAAQRALHRTRDTHLRGLPRAACAR